MNMSNGLACNFTLLENNRAKCLKELERAGFKAGFSSPTTHLFLCVLYLEVCATSIVSSLQLLCKLCEITKVQQLLFGWGFKVFISAFDSVVVIVKELPVM